MGATWECVLDRGLVRMKTVYMATGGFILLLVMLETVAENTGSNSESLDISRLASELFSLNSQLVELQNKMTELKKEKVINKKKITQLENLNVEREAALKDVGRGNTEDSINTDDY